MTRNNVAIICGTRSLPEYSTVGLVIDCGTKWLSMLAAVSFVRNSGLPLIFMDCARDDDTPDLRKLFPDIYHMIHLIKCPLDRHGRTLDKFFHTIRSEFIYLIDSDAELTDRNLPGQMMSALKESSDFYGSGMLHRNEILSSSHLFSNSIAEYQERMWIPFVLLRTNLIKKTLDEEKSFMQITEYPIVTGFRYLDRLLGLRYRALWWPVNRIHIGVNGNTPIIKYFDTGSSIHAAMKAKGWGFKEVPNVSDGVIHLHGATRRILPSRLRQLLYIIGIKLTDNATDITDLATYSKSRLTTIYGYDVEGYGTTGP